MDGSMRRRPSATDISKVVSGTPGNGCGVSESFKEDVRITFGLVTSVEWIELGSQVLVMPGMSMTASSGVAVAPTPGTGAGNGTGNGIVSMSGLEGFVGTVCEVVPGRSVGSEI
jgi:hypothetical protein